MENMITVKEYAEKRGITIQAVHKSMNGKRKAERLEGHVRLINGVKWLDEEAVRILDEARNQSPTVILDSQRQEEIDALLEKIEKLENRLERKDVLIEKLQNRVEEKDNRIEELKKETLLLEEKKHENKQLETAVGNLKELVGKTEEKYQNMKKEADELHLKNQELQNDLQKEQLRKWKFPWSK